MTTIELNKKDLMELYISRGKSAHEIAALYNCSDSRISYWLKKFCIQKRSVADSQYRKHNPNGDPFFFNQPSNAEEQFLLGLGLGLYWGEGNKKNKTAVRLGNTDPKLIKKFVEFLRTIYCVEDQKFRFGLQVFSDMDPKEALDFWCTALEAPPTSFGKVIVTPTRSIGTYKEKTRHGVLTVYVCNRKLRDILCHEIEKLQEIA